MAIKITKRKMELSGTSHERIAELEYVNDGTASRIGRVSLHDWLVDGGSAFVKDNVGDTVYVYPRQNTYGTKYVQTKADGIWKDNLLALPQYY